MVWLVNGMVQDGTARSMCTLYGNKNVVRAKCPTSNMTARQYSAFVGISALWSLPKVLSSEFPTFAKFDLSYRRKWFISIKWCLSPEPTWIPSHRIQPNPLADAVFFSLNRRIYFANCICLPVTDDVGVLILLLPLIRQCCRLSFV